MKSTPKKATPARSNAPGAGVYVLPEAPIRGKRLTFLNTSLSKSSSDCENLTAETGSGNIFGERFTQWRDSRVVAADVPHHVTQRGNGRRFILASDTDRSVYLTLLRENIESCRVSLLGYCLMSNHIHLVVVPRKAEGLARALRQTHGRYASYWNAVHGSSGHVWQGRYYSCPLDQAHLWEALRYTELNPIRAGLVAEAESWRWSSALAHCHKDTDNGLLTMLPWQDHWSEEAWR
jgi:putative transposase